MIRDQFNVECILTAKSTAFLDEPGLLTTIFWNRLDTFVISKCEMTCTSCPALSKAFRIGSKNTKWLSPWWGKIPRILALSVGTVITARVINKEHHVGLSISRRID